MKYTFYAERPARRTRQMLIDLLVLLWSWWWIAAGIQQYSRISGKGNATGDRVEKLGTNVVERVNQTADISSGLPFVGGRLAEELRKLAFVNDETRDMAFQIRDLSHQSALSVGLVTAILPIVLVLMIWLPLRLRYVLIETRNIPRDRTSPDAVERLALQALVNCRADQIAQVHPRAMQSWRDGDEDVMKELAELELHRVGLTTTGGRKRVRRVRKKVVKS